MIDLKRAFLISVMLHFLGTALLHRPPSFPGQWTDHGDNFIVKLVTIRQAAGNDPPGTELQEKAEGEERTTEKRKKIPPAAGTEQIGAAAPATKSSPAGNVGTVSGGRTNPVHPPSIPAATGKRGVKHHRMEEPVRVEPAANAGDKEGNGGGERSPDPGNEPASIESTRGKPVRLTGDGDNSEATPLYSKGGPDDAVMETTGGGSAGRGTTVDPSLVGIILARIESAKVYPKAAVRRRLEGTATVKFRIAPDGTVEEIHIVESSGFSILDRASVKTVKRAAPLPYIDSWLKVAVAFRLTKVSGRF